MRIASKPFVMLAMLTALAVAGCSSAPRKKVVKTGSVSVSTVSLMRDRDMDRAAPILFRVFKEEGQLEVWKEDRSGRYRLLRTYEICKFSGKLGPKKREGDRQAPEGFYAVKTASLNPYSRNHLAFNIGFPNALDRSLGYTGTNLMVHGGCNSVGCYAMTHKSIEEIYALAREPLLAGQTSILFQAFPFRMTEANMARHADNPATPFWRSLKRGHDIFLQTGMPPRVFACAGKYGFAPAGQGAADGSDICAAVEREAEDPSYAMDQSPGMDRDSSRYR